MMGDTPKLPKGRGRSSLSLNKRLKKRLSSPQNCMQATDNATNLQSSPKVSFNMEANDFTPPHKKLNLDDSFDDSPSSFDGHSPTAFLSQTFGSDSPEVGWRWSIDNNENVRNNVKTDSGFSSNSSCSKDSKVKRTRSETSRQSYLNKRGERKRAKEAELRKAEKARTEALLRERLAKLERQLSGVCTTTDHTEEDKKEGNIEKSPAKNENIFDDFDNIFEESNIDFDVNIAKPTASVEEANHDKETLDDFFNDSDTDCLLVAATQQLETAKSELTQPKQKPNATSQQTHPEKRSSLYMQLLEDDDDDFFVSLDESWLQKATQSVKPRSPFQRYKSMPVSTTVTDAAASTSLGASTKYERDKNNINPNGNASNANSSAHSNKTIKRHASSHAMSPSSTNYRGRDLPSRN